MQVPGMNPLQNMQNTAPVGPTQSPTGLSLIHI